MRCRSAIHTKGSFAGRTGSGKSSSTGRQLALAQLATGFGGLVCTVKVEEAETWKEYCRQTNRLADLRVVDHTAKYRFDFLQALRDSQGEDAGLTENIVSLLMEVGQVGSRQSSTGSAQGDNVLIDLLLMATGRHASQSDGRPVARID